jgi:exonuclease SbcC
VKEIDKDVLSVRSEVGRYERLPPASELQEELDSWRGRLTDTTESNERMGKISEMIGALEGQIAGLVSANKLLKAHINEAQANVDTLKSIDEPQCPTCHQPLSEAERESVMQDILAAITISNNDIAANKEGAFAKQEEQQNLRKEEDELQEHIGNVRTVERTVTQLEAQIEGLDEKIATKERAEERLAEFESRLTDARTEADGAASKVVDLESEFGAPTITDAELQRMRKEKEDADRAVGALQQQLEGLKQTEKQVAAWRSEEKDLAADLGVIKEVRAAFSKKGVPAMLIEQAVPEIERGANELLMRLTDGRMHVRFDTLKELKSGDMAEALDIVISDELGARSYENYSGGEKFKINFAIRIALSKLLAKRAGVQLRSLFIDEGFGTQDAAGREQVVAAINTIKDDFDCILVITHIEELKEAFPVQIEVIKSDSGSTFRTVR